MVLLLGRSNCALDLQPDVLRKAAGQGRNVPINYKLSTNNVKARSSVILDNASKLVSAESAYGQYCVIEINLQGSSRDCSPGRSKPSNFKIGLM